MAGDLTLAVRPSPLHLSGPDLAEQLDAATARISGERPGLLERVRQVVAQQSAAGASAEEAVRALHAAGQRLRPGREAS